MTITEPEIRRDAKAGYCNMCRGGTHALCAAPGCRCTGHRHPNRPSPSPSLPSEPADESPVAEVRARAQRSATPDKANGTTTKTAPAKLREPVWQLVKADPPAPPPKPRKLTVVERARPLVEQVMAEGDRDWHRLAIFPSANGAAMTCGRLRKAYREFEFRSVKISDVGQSALYGRWTGATSRGQL